MIGRPLPKASRPTLHHARAGRVVGDRWPPNQRPIAEDPQRVRRRHAHNLAQLAAPAQPSWVRWGVAARPSALESLSGSSTGPLFDAMLEAALGAVAPAPAVRRSLGWLTPDMLRVGEVVQRLSPGARVHFVAAGKAAHGMLRGALAAFEGHPERLGDVVISAPPGDPFESSSIPATQVTAFFGGHPLPNQDSLDAGHAALELARRVGPDDLLLALISGGSSAMLSACPLPLDEWVACTQGLLELPVDIALINDVRAQLDPLKYGGLLAAAGDTRCAALILSDVPGAAPHVVGSGPTRVHGVDRRQLVDRLRDAGVWDRLSTRAHTAIARQRPRYEPQRRAFDTVVADNADARRAACQAAMDLGWTAIDLGGGLRGEVEPASVQFLAELQRPELDALAQRPRVVVAGGECVVRRRGHGRGGRNCAFALSVLRQMSRSSPASSLGVSALMTIATDGADGNSGAAGAVATPQGLARANAEGLDLEAAWRNDDSAALFDRLADLLVTGATGTNVADLVFAVQAT